MTAGKIRVVMVGNYAFRYTNMIANYLSKRADIELHLIATGRKEDLIKKDKIFIHYIKVGRPYHLQILRALPAISEEIAQLDPDIIHVVQQMVYSRSAIPHIGRYPTVLTVLGLISREYMFDIDYKSIRSICGYFYKQLIGMRTEEEVISKFPNIIVESSSNREILTGMTSSKIYVVPDGVEFRYIQKLQPGAIEIPDVFYIGCLHDGKGVDLLIKATPEIAKVIPDFKLAIAGKGIQEKWLRKLADKMRLNGRVRFLGFIPEENKFSYLKHCKLVAVPSRWDFSPLTIYEAMACGKPVVASDNTNSEILVDKVNGLLFQSGDADDLAEKVIRLLTDESLRTEMSRNSLEKAMQYDWESIARITVDVYRDMIECFHHRGVES